MAGRTRPEVFGMLHKSTKSVFEMNRKNLRIVTSLDTALKQTPTITGILENPETLKKMLKFYLKLVRESQLYSYFSHLIR